jgi:hypothetical protein
VELSGQLYASASCSVEEGSRFIIIIIIIITTTITTIAIGLSPGGSSPTLVQAKIKIHKTLLQNKYKTKITQNNKITQK